MFTEASVENMTGTPLMNAPIDLYPILNWLGYEKHTFWQFKTHYGRLGGFNGTQVVGYKNLEEIEDTLDTMMLRRLKDDVLDLPEKTLINEYVEMGKEQSKVYDMAHSDIVSNLANLKMANNPLAELIRLRQATGKRLQADFGGIASLCADVVSKPYLTNESNVSFACNGSRGFTGIDDNELVIGLTMEDVLSLVNY